MAARERGGGAGSPPLQRQPAFPLRVQLRFFFWLPVTFVSFLTLGSLSLSLSHTLKGRLCTVTDVYFVVYMHDTLSKSLQLFACKKYLFFNHCF